MEILDPNGLRLPIITGDIASPVNGDIWYNSTLGKFRKYQNGATTDLDTTGGGGGGLTNTQIQARARLA